MILCGCSYLTLLAQSNSIVNAIKEGSSRTMHSVVIKSMIQRTLVLLVLGVCCPKFCPSARCFTSVTAFQVPSTNHDTKPANPIRLLDRPVACSSRRDVFSQWIQTSISAATCAAAVLIPTAASAKPDCYTDCLKNCKSIAPNNMDYCQNSCIEYCQQPDREDGLSGSVSAVKGETGILGGSFGQGTVPKGEDKPPSLIRVPGLDFSSEAGRKLIGY